MTAKLQPPVGKPVVELRWREDQDAGRLLRVTEILRGILANPVDSGGTPEEVRKR